MDVARDQAPLFFLQGLDVGGQLAQFLARAGEFLFGLLLRRDVGDDAVEQPVAAIGFARGGGELDPAPAAVAALDLPLTLEHRAHADSLFQRGEHIVAISGIEQFDEARRVGQELGRRNVEQAGRAGAYKRHQQHALLRPREHLEHHARQVGGDRGEAGFGFTLRQFGALLLGVVGHEHHHAGRLLGAQAGGGEGEIARRAIFADPGLLEVLHRATANRQLQAFDHVAVVGVGDGLRPADRGASLDPEHALGGGVEQGDVALGVEGDDGDRRGGQHGAQVIQRGAQLGGRGAPLAPLGGRRERVLDRRRQPLQAVLHQVVVGAGLHRRHRRVFADGAGDDQERGVAFEFAQDAQRRDRREARQIVIGNHHIPFAGRQGRAHAGFILDPNRGVRQAGGAQGELQQFEIDVGILDTQDAHADAAAGRRRRRLGQGLETVGDAEPVGIHRRLRGATPEGAAKAIRQTDARRRDQSGAGRSALGCTVAARDRTALARAGNRFKRRSTAAAVET